MLPSMRTKENPPAEPHRKARRSVSQIPFGPHPTISCSLPEKSIFIKLLAVDVINVSEAGGAGWIQEMNSLGFKRGRPV